MGSDVPIVGIVVTTSPNLSLYRIVVLPAASRPTIRIRISFLPKRRSNTREKAIRFAHDVGDLLPATSIGLRGEVRLVCGIERRPLDERGLAAELSDLLRDGVERGARLRAIRQDGHAVTQVARAALLGVQSESRS